MRSIRLPPIGMNLSVADCLGSEDLSTALKKVVKFLRHSEAPAYELLEYADWWEHDGLHFEKKRIDFEVLTGMVETPMALYNAVPGDTLVFVGIAPLKMNWYLRFFLDIDDDEISIENRLGRFDITLPLDWIEKFKQEVCFPLGLEMICQDSQSYYHTIMR